jgi:hypothetical protein
MHIQLAYAPADGQEPAGRLAELLETVGLMMVEAEPAPQGTGVIALLTPAALADRAVLAALQAASSQGRPLLPLSLAAPAAFPTAEDLARILEWRAAAPAQASKYHVVNAVNSTIGDNAVTVNVSGPVAGWSAAETAGIVAALRRQQPGAAINADELRGLFAGLQSQMQRLEGALRQGFTLILARFDLAEQRILAPVLARLDAQETALVAALLEALEGRVFPAEELGQHLAVIQMALAQINVRSAQMRDQQLAAAVQHAAEIVSAPSLDVKHKLKVTLPIVPALIAYEEEFELGSGMNLPEVWRRLRARISGQR